MHRKYELSSTYLQTFSLLKTNTAGLRYCEKTQLRTFSFMVGASQREIYFASLHPANFRKIKHPKNHFLNFIFPGWNCWDLCVQLWELWKFGKRF